MITNPLKKGIKPSNSFSYAWKKKNIISKQFGEQAKNKS